MMICTGNYIKKIKALLRFLQLTILLLCFSANRVIAQEIQLSSKDRNNRESVSVKLYDNNEGQYLLDLPLTFHINKDNILFMIVGSDNGINGNYSVLMFDKDVILNDFLKSNKNFSTDKTFRKQINRLESFFSQSENVEKHTYFDNGFEYVLVSPKPVFFKVKDASKPVVLKLKFYASSEKNDNSKVLTSETGIVKITINLTK